MELLMPFAVGILIGGVLVLAGAWMESHLAFKAPRRRERKPKPPAV